MDLPLERPDEALRQAFTVQAHRARMAHGAEIELRLPFLRRERVPVARDAAEAVAQLVPPVAERDGLRLAGERLDLEIVLAGDRRL